MPISPARIAEGLELRPFSVAEYRALGEVGILGESDRVELLEGLISPKMIHSPLHDATVSLVEGELRRGLDESWLLRIQSAVTTADSEPEPDVALVRGPATRYLQQHPQGEDIALVVEVAETSLARDRLKAAIYAAAGIPIYWLVHLTARQIEVYSHLTTGESGASYGQCDRYGAGEQVPFPVPRAAAASIAVDRIFP